MMQISPPRRDELANGGAGSPPRQRLTTYRRPNDPRAPRRGNTHKKTTVRRTNRQSYGTIGEITTHRRDPTDTPTRTTHFSSRTKDCVSSHLIAQGQVPLKRDCCASLDRSSRTPLKGVLVRLEKRCFTYHSTLCRSLALSTTPCTANQISRFRYTQERRLPP
jgi:hypothetical protein